MKYIIFLLTVCLVASCKQKEEPLPKPTYKFTVTNNDGIALNYDIYASADDYNSATNAIASFRLEDDQKQDVDVTNFINSEKLYTDIYSDDRFYSNILTERDVVYNTDSLVSNKRYVGISHHHQDSISIHYFTHDRKSVTWKGFDYYDSPNYTWDTLPEYKKYFELTLNKDGSCKMLRKDIAGNIITENGTMRREGTNGLYIWTDYVWEYHVTAEPTGPVFVNKIFVREGSWKGYICAPVL